MLFNFHGRSAANHEYYQNIDVRSKILMVFEKYPDVSVGGFTEDYFDIMGRSHFCLVRAAEHILLCFEISGAELPSELLHPALRARYRGARSCRKVRTPWPSTCSRSKRSLPQVRACRCLPALHALGSA